MKRIYNSIIIISPLIPCSVSFADFHDGKILASASWDAMIYLWDMKEYNALYKSKSVDLDDKLIATWGKVKDQLYQNYPNPFNPETWIPYITICIYDMQGRLVRNLNLGYEKAGIHKTKWDGRDNNGQSVSSRAYFYTLKTGNFSDTRKMIVVK